MKSRTSFFDKAVLRKDLTRFWPLWAIYLIGGLLIMHTATGFYDSYFRVSSYNLARDLNTLIGPFSIVSAGYGFLVAQLLFGDLHNSRLCNGLHAMPLRREGWYLTHVTSGLMMGLVPPLVIVLSLLPILGSFWATGFLCWGGMSLHYLLFFGLAVFCMMCTGNRFAAAAVYGLINVLSLVVRWFCSAIYLPMLPGVRINPDNFNLFCPIAAMVGLDDFFLVAHSPDCGCQTKLYGGYGITDLHDYAFQGLGDSWGYLWVTAAIGIALLGLALVLYRRRHLERAGDFMVFKPMKPVFLTVYSMCVGAVLYYLGDAVNGTSTGYAFFALGLVMGYLSGKMLLERTLRVFSRKSMLGMGILFGAVALSLLLTWLDPVGIARRVPDSDKVSKVYLYDGYLNDHNLDKEMILQQTYTITVTDPEDIAAICNLQSTMLAEHKTPGNQDRRHFTIQYVMKNGSRMTRSYYIYERGEARNGLNEYFSKPEYLFGASTPEQLMQSLTYVYCRNLGDIPKAAWKSLLDALWADASEGHVFWSKTYDKDNGHVEFSTHYGGYRNLYFTDEATHTAQWLEEYQHSAELVFRYDSAEQLYLHTQRVFADELDLTLKAYDCKEFIDLLWQDCASGWVTPFEKGVDDGLYVQIETNEMWISVSLDYKAPSAQWLMNYQKEAA